MRIRKFQIALPLIIIVAFSSAQTSSNPTTSVSSERSHVEQPSGAQYTPALQDRHPRYEVMPSDVLSISFPLSPELNQSVTVQPDGFISLASAGPVYIQGQTTTQIVETVAKAYEKILHNPIIAVDLKNFQTPQFTILGQVWKPGQYQLRYDTTLSQAIAVGGGFLPSAKKQVFLLHRVSADWVEVKKFNIKDIVEGKKISEDIHLQAGDMIFVPETFIAHFRRYLPYNVGFNPQGLALALD